ncbi:MAG: O-antigen ligase family protein [Pseudomonadota bacterium]
MSAQTAPRQFAQITNPVVRLRMRQLALFAGMLLSGGLLLIPREPLLALVLILCFALTNPLSLFRREFSLVWIVLALTVAVALIGGQSFQVMPMVIRYANFFGGLALLAMYLGESRRTLADDLYPILKLMAFQALLTPFVYILFQGYFWSFQVHNTIYTTLFYIFTFHDLIDTGSLFKRPDGFFFEPGVFHIYLNIFLFIALFVRKRSPFDIALAALAVMATQSTTGVIVLMMQFAYAYFNWLKTADRGQKLGVFVFVPLLLMPLAGYMAYNVVEKFTGEFRGSAEAREYDLVTGLRVVAEQPLTGIGFDEERYFDYSQRLGYREVDLSDENITERGNTNGIVSLLFNLGIPMGAMFLFGVFRQRMFAPRLLFAGIIIVSLLTEALFLKPFFLMIAFSGLLLVTSKVKARKRDPRVQMAARAPAAPPKNA